MALLKAASLDLPIQFENFRDWLIGQIFEDQAKNS
jgi:hypothetical protein